MRHRAKASKGIERMAHEKQPEIVEMSVHETISPESAELMIDGPRHSNKTNLSFCANVSCSFYAISVFI